MISKKDMEPFHGQMEECMKGFGRQENKTDKGISIKEEIGVSDFGKTVKSRNGLVNEYNYFKHTHTSHSDFGLKTISFLLLGQDQMS